MQGMSQDEGGEEERSETPSQDAPDKEEYENRSQEEQDASQEHSQEMSNTDE